MPEVGANCVSLSYVGAEDSVFDYAETAEVVAATVPSARVESVEGGHAVDPAHPVVLAFIDEVLDRR